MLAEKIKYKILAQKEQGLFRDPYVIEKKERQYVWIDGRKVVNFCSNDYLGMTEDIKLNKKIAYNFSHYQASSSSSRLVSGNSKIIRTAEMEYAKYFGYEDAMFFSSGMQANIGIISTLAMDDSVYLYDKRIHASTVKGMMLSNAKKIGFNHNSLKHLEKRLKSLHPSKDSIVLTESLFSMDGDTLDVDCLKKMKEQYSFFSVVDEAHSFGVLGYKGKGLAHGISDLSLGTFGKSFGLFGAFALMSRDMREYFVNFSAPYIYTTALPSAHANTTVDILERIEDMDSIRLYLSEISDMMKNELVNSGFNVHGDAHIISIEIGDEIKCYELSKKLLDRGHFVLSARYPTVPMGKSILRIGMTALHNEDNIRDFVNTLRELNDK